jgi:hypothetical protein
VLHFSGWDDVNVVCIYFGCLVHLNQINELFYRAHKLVEHLSNAGNTQNTTANSFSIDDTVNSNNISLNNSNVVSGDNSTNSISIGLRSSSGWNVGNNCWNGGGSIGTSPQQLLRQQQRQWAVAWYGVGCYYYAIRNYDTARKYFR